MLLIIVKTQCSVGTLNLIQALSTNVWIALINTIGWSDCGTDHMENSIRFGWRWIDDSLEIHWFKHEHGKFSFDLIKRVDLCKEHYYELTIFRWDYKMGVDGTYVYVPRNCVYDKRRYQLYPYFGGEESAPHDINIKIKKR